MLSQLPMPIVPGVTHTFININNVKLHVAEIGKGKPLVLLHGWPQHWYVWRKIIPFLKNDFRLIMPDLRGFGWSEAPLANNYNKEQLATDLLTLLDRLKLKQVGLVGHDWGGWIGFLACLRSPQRFTAFLALGILHPFQKVDHRIVQFWRGSYQIPIVTPLLGEFFLRKTPFVKKILRAAATQQDTFTEKDLDIFSHVLQQPARAHASSLLYRTFLMQELLPVLRGKYLSQRLKVPTKLLVGENDPVIRKEHIAGYEQYADHMEVAFIKDCGHFIPEEKPELVVEEIQKLFTAKKN